MPASVVVSPDGQFVAAAEGGSQTIVVWYRQKSNVPVWSHAMVEEATAMALSPDGAHLVMGTVSGTLEKRATRTPERLLTIPGHGGYVSASRFSPNGELLATASRDRTVKLWNAHDMKLLATLQGHASGITCVAFSPGGNTLVTGDGFGTLRFWHVDTYQELAVFEHLGTRISALCFSPDGCNLAVAIERDEHGAVLTWSRLPSAASLPARGPRSRSR